MPPPTDPSTPELTLPEIVERVGLYPIEAYEFVQQGLSYTVERTHGTLDLEKVRSAEDLVSRHVDGRMLCHGLRDYALMKWGMLARTVLNRWNIRRTIDFGRIVFALVDHGHMQKTDEDSVDDFRDVFDFASAFESGYRIEQNTP